MSNVGAADRPHVNPAKSNSVLDVRTLIYVVSASIVVIVALIAGGQLVERRRHDRLTKAFAARGLKVVGVRFTTIPAMRDLVDYIGPQGELRQASVPLGRADPSEDQPFQVVLRERFERWKSQPQLASLKLVAEYSRLPGYDEYQSIARELAGGAAAVTLAESAPNAQAKWRFAPVLQCLEAVSICGEGRAHRIGLVVDGKPIDMRWSLQGVPPRRMLVITAIRPGE